ncbi:peptidase M23 [Syntrophotalea acetylenivorans]|uniref:Peptidase M23 n=1 Tax=Syntrophotalea acetylenivorans TaxID=1842532 RepID=A0A1L3GSA4_9BACT|nr:M23 family metallopeptidase [Syntrophotalea acetylenivorans]APG28750.1 peptidase M23 [Syntrophotalea acetylenivorans]
MNNDFNPPRTSMVQRTRSNSRFINRRFLLPLLVLLGLGSLLLLSNRQQADLIAQDGGNTIPEISAVPEVKRELVRGAIQPGETITSLLGHIFTPQQIHNLNKQCKEVFPLSKLCAGQDYRLALRDGAFERFEYDIDNEEQLIILQNEEGFDISRTAIPYTVEQQLINGTITSSLFNAVLKSGESETLAINLADIFAWDIDFIRDIQNGDSFQVLVEKRFREGKQAGYGRILAATFANRGETFQAYLFKDGNQRAAYYDEQGKSLRKAFLKAPLSFSRISSGFSLRRFHPITKTWKSHPAIDYAAPTGTPIKAIGDGVISRIGRTKHNGNFIKLRHSNGMQSLYLHMNGFARKMRMGKRVAQGQTIGYVGMTGLATGPHLCFRMYKNGRPINPARLKSTPTAPVSKANMAAFKTAIAPLVAQLGEGIPAATQIAAAKQSEHNETASN